MRTRDPNKLCSLSTMPENLGNKPLGVVHLFSMCLELAGHFYVLLDFCCLDAHFVEILRLSWEKLSGS